MTEQVQDSLQEKQNNSALKLKAIDDLQEFYKNNKDSFWFRMFFPNRLGAALQNKNYDYQEVYAAYFARSRWLQFFFGGFPEITTFTNNRISKEAFSSLDKGGDLVVDYEAQELSDFTRFILNEEVMSFLRKSSSEEEFIEYFNLNRGIDDDPIRRNVIKVDSATTNKLKALSDANRNKIYKIIKTIDEQIGDKGLKLGKKNWSFPLLKVIIDENNLDLLEVVYDLVVTDQSLVKSGNIKTYTLDLLNLSDASVVNAVQKINDKQMNLGTRMSLLDKSMISSEVKDPSRRLFKKERARALARKKAEEEAKRKSANDSEIQSQASADSDETLVDGYHSDTSSITSANTEHYDARDNRKFIFLSNLSWWQSSEQDWRSIKTKVAEKSDADRQILESICNNYGLIGESGISKERFMKILSLNSDDMLALETLIGEIQGKIKPPEVSAAKVALSESHSIGLIIDGSIPSAKKGLAHGFFGGLRQAGESLGVNSQRLDDSSTDSLTTTSSSSVGYDANTGLQELKSVVEDCKKLNLDVLSDLLKFNNFNPAVKIIKVLLRSKNNQVQGTIAKILKFNQEQIEDVYQCLLVLEKPNNVQVNNFENLHMAITNAKVHTIFTDLHQYDKLFSGESALTDNVLHIILSNDRKDPSGGTIKAALHGYQTNHAAISQATSQVAENFFGTTKKLAGSLGNTISSMLHHNENRNDRNIKR